MAINIIKEGDLYITKEELNKTREEYLARYKDYVGRKPSLETYIRSKQNGELEQYEKILSDEGRLFKRRP